MKTGKLILFTGLAVVVILVVINHELVYYGYVQAKGQFNIIWQAVPVDEILNDPEFPDSLKTKLRLIEEAKEFAVYDLGLKGIKNYTTYYDQKGKDLLWVVSACEPFDLEAYKWGFPILGQFSYKGFFNHAMAVDEMKKLRKKGYDANIRTAGGWSTLGILKDPVLSNMLRRNEGSLIDLIIHELTHGTIFIKDSLEFNENLATFIGHAGTQLFMTEKYGKSSAKLQSYIQKIEDQKKFTDYVLRGAVRLDSLYGTFTNDMNDEKKLDRKKTAIQEFTSGIQDICFYNKEYLNYFEDFTPDNTFFMSYLRYRGGQEVFEVSLEKDFFGDLPAYIEALKEKHRK
jgi:predicted aminopeptidase